MKSKIIDGRKYVELDIADIYIDGNRVEKEFKLEKSTVDLLVKLTEPINSVSEETIEDIASISVKDEYSTEKNKHFKDNTKPHESKKIIYAMLIIAVVIIMVQTAIIYIK